MQRDPTRHATGNARSLLALVVLMTTACGNDVASSVSTSFFESDGGVSTSIEGFGIVVKMDESVSYRYERLSETGKPDVRKTLVNGMEFELLDDGFRLGDDVFGGLRAGDRVQISADGFLVNGERRWDMPGS